MRVDGSTPQFLRQGIVTAFSEATKHCVFIASTMAAGEGLNIQAASAVILMDSCWNPCPDEQVICRAYRYGQTKTVNVYRLISSGTMEELVLKKQFEKSRLASKIVDGVLQSDPGNWRLKFFNDLCSVNKEVPAGHDECGKLFKFLNSNDMGVPSSIVTGVLPLDVTEKTWDYDEEFERAADKSYNNFVNKVNQYRRGDKRAKKPNYIKPPARAYRALYL